MVEIADEDRLFRRLAGHQVNRDGTANSSAVKRGGAFEERISVDVARLTDAQSSVDRAGRAGFRLGEIEAGRARALGFRVEHDPLPDNEAHALIIGPNDQARSRALARAVRIAEGIESHDPGQG